MNLNDKVKLKNELLTQQASELHQHFEARLKAPMVASKMFLFAVSPIVIAIFLGVSRAPKTALTGRLWRILFLGWRLMPLYKNFQKSEMHR